MGGSQDAEGHCSKSLLGLSTAAQRSVNSLKGWWRGLLVLHESSPSRERGGQPTKFTGGAWVVVVAVPILILIFKRIEKYYLRVGSELNLGKLPGKPKPEKTTVVVPISQISKLTEHAIAEARSLSDDVIALFVINKVPVDDPSNPKMSDSDAAAEAIVAQWEKWNPGVKLEVLESDYASIIEPIVGYIDELRKQVNHQIVVLIPVIVPDKARYRILHNQIDLLLSNALSDRTDLIVARAKYQLSAQP